MPKQKIIYGILLALMFVLSFLGWVNLRKILFNSSGFGGIFLTAALFLLAMAIFAVAVLILDSWKMLAAAAGMVLLAYILTFGYHWAYLAVLIVGFCLSLAGIAGAKKEKGAHIKILPSQIARPASRALFTVLAIAVSAVLYFSPPAQGLKAEIKIPRRLFDIILESMAGFIEGQAKSLLEGRPILSILGLPQLNGLEIQKIEGIDNQGIDNLSSDEILKPKDRDNLYQLITRQINFFIQPYKRFLPYGLAIAVFFSLKAIDFIFIWLAGLITGLLFSLLKAAKVVNVGKEMAEREKIEIG